MQELSRKILDSYLSSTYKNKSSKEIRKLTNEITSTLSSVAAELSKKYKKD